ncbi:MFS transporter [Anabaena sp. FACHB-1237]|nr:MFS transporter [Anabaena sp. FACHB-1237]
MDIILDSESNSEILDIGNNQQFPGKIRTRFAKKLIRNSLRASTIDAIFASVFSLGTGGVLLSNFLVELNATPVIFGMLSSIPMIVNFIQPIGAYISEKTHSRFQYSLVTFGASRLLWISLLIGITAHSQNLLNNQKLIILTLIILLGSNLLAALGAPSWLSWLAMIIPSKLRGRYFGLRTSAANLTNLLCVPLAGIMISHWYSGSIQGYGLVVLISIIFGIMALGCQYFQVDINPQIQNHQLTEFSPTENNHSPANSNNSTQESSIISSLCQNTNFLIFLLYFSIWMLAVHLSAPFFNLYLLDTLNLDVSLVTIYSSLQTGANLLMLIFWGKLADKIGNRYILIFVGLLVAITPLLWIGISNRELDIWLWLPLLHIFAGITWGGIDICTTNMYLTIAPTRNQSIYFAIAAAVAGVSGALGTTIGGFITQIPYLGGLIGLFAISSILRFLGLIPLMFVKEPER